MGSSILERIAAGDPRAVDECLEAFGGLVWSLARRFSSVYADAEDAVQEIFFEIWRCSSRYDPNVASEAAFISTIARRRLIDRHRRHSRTIDAGPLEEQSTLIPAESVDSVELQEEAARVRVVMGQLRENERRVLELSLVEGLTHSEISEATSLPLGTVKTHARRGLSRLREMLGAERVSSTLDTEP